MENFSLSDYKHVIWDWNGTLFSDVEICCDIMNYLLTERGMGKISLEKYREIFTFPVKEYYRIAGHDISDENWEIISHEFIHEYERRKNSCGLYDKAVDVLEHIKSKGISQSVLSAYSQHTLEEMINQYNLSKYFIRLVGLDNIYATSKLANGIKWMNELGLNNNKVLMIGDTEHDFEVANGIGADCLLISSGHQNKNKLLKQTSNVIDSISQLLNY